MRQRKVYRESATCARCGRMARFESFSSGMAADWLRGWRYRGGRCPSCFLTDNVDRIAELAAPIKAARGIP